jgi:hypothetical protein
MGLSYEEQQRIMKPIGHLLKKKTAPHHPMRIEFLISFVIS